MRRSSFYIPIAFLVISFVLLIIPGNEFPKAKVFNIPGIDKVVHIGIFALLVVLFCRPFRHSVLEANQHKSLFLQIAVYAFLYGIIMEFVQKYFVPNRSFEFLDIVVDGIGALVGLLYSRKAFPSTVRV